MRRIHQIKRVDWKRKRKKKKALLISKFSNREVFNFYFIYAIILAQIPETFCNSCRIILFTSFK